MNILIDMMPIILKKISEDRAEKIKVNIKNYKLTWRITIKMNKYISLISLILENLIFNQITLF